MRRTLFAVLIASLTLAVAFVPAAGASDERRAGVRLPRSEHQRIVDYWTKARRDSAVPRDLVRNAAPHEKAKGGKKPGGGDSSGSGDVLGTAWTGGGSVVKTTGKVFFTLNGTRYVCSASAVAGRNANLVMTAGHCAHGGGPSGQKATEWAFYPAYDNGTAPYGVWTAGPAGIHPTTNWMTRSNHYDDDAAFVSVTGSGSASLAQALSPVTLPRVDFGVAVAERYTAFGYPAAGKYNGQRLIYCSGPSSTTRDRYETISIPCNMTGGSSGGPWYVGSSHNTAGAAVNSVNSYGYSSLKNVMFGPVFGTQERDAFIAAGG